MSSGSPISTAAGCWPSRPGTARRSTPPRQYHDTRSANVDRLPRSTAAAGLRRRRPPPPALLWRASGTTTEVPVGAPPARCTAREQMMSGRLRAGRYRGLERRAPAGLPGGSKGDLLARLISDTDEVQDLVVRAAVPVVVTAVTWAAATATAAVLLPQAGVVLLAAGLLGAAGVAAAAARCGRRSAPLPAARGAVGEWVLQALTSAEELAALGADEWAAAKVADCERELGTRTRAVAAAAGLGRAVATFAGGAALAGVVWAGAAALRAGQIGAPELGALAFLAFGVAVLLQGMPDAVSRLPVRRPGIRGARPCRPGRRAALPSGSCCGERPSHTRATARRAPFRRWPAWMSTSRRAGRGR